MKEQTFKIELKDGTKIDHTNLVLKRIPIRGSYFLEFGKHRNGDCTYIALLKGDIQYYGNNPKIQEEIYFAFKQKRYWRILDMSYRGTVEDHKRKCDTVQRLICIVSSLP